MLPRKLPDDWSAKKRLQEALREAWSDIDAPGPVGLLVEVLREHGAEARARRVVELVQTLPYRPDPPGGDWVQSAATTVERGGDCEDLSALAAVLATSAGVPGRLLWLYQPRRVRDHVAPQFCIAGRWEFGEVTLRPSAGEVNARLGESPYAAAQRLKDSRALGEVIHAR